MIVRDEERLLGRALSSVIGVVDEICVVDTGSTDRTIEVARGHGARIASFPWCDDFAAARNAALAMARYRWIFVLDADETLVPGSRDALRALGREPADELGRYVAIRNLSDDIAGSGAMTNAVVRIFANQPHIRYVGAVHEHVAANGSRVALPALATSIEIVHSGYLGAVVRDRQKAQRNLRIAEAELARHPDDSFAWYNVAMSLAVSGQRERARTALQRVRELTAAEPRGFRPQALVALGDIELAEGRLDDALTIADECVAVVPTYADGLFLRGRVLAALGRAADARESYRAAVSSEPFTKDHFVVDDEIAIWKAANEMAVSLMAEGAHAEALRWLDGALERRPHAQPLVLNRARCLEALGDLESAQIVFAGAAAAYRDERSADELARFVVTWASPGRAVEGLETALPLLAPDGQRLFLATAGALAFRDGDRHAAAGYVERARAIGDPQRTAALLPALAARFGVPGFPAAVTHATPEIRFFTPYDALG